MWPVTPQHCYLLNQFKPDAVFQREMSCAALAVNLIPAARPREAASSPRPAARPSQPTAFARRLETCEARNTPTRAELSEERFSCLSRRNREDDWRVQAAINQGGASLPKPGSYSGYRALSAKRWREAKEYELEKNSPDTTRLTSQMECFPKCVGFLMHPYTGGDDKTNIGEEARCGSRVNKP